MIARAIVRPCAIGIGWDIVLPDIDLGQEFVSMLHLVQVPTDEKGLIIIPVLKKDLAEKCAALWDKAITELEKRNGSGPSGPSSPD